MAIKLKVGIIVSDGSRTLLIKERSSAECEPRWNFIKGTFEEELDHTITEAALRECREEAMIEVELFRLLGVYYFQGSTGPRTQFNFVAKLIEGTPAVPPEEEQGKHGDFITDLGWFTTEELAALMPEECINLQTYAALQDYLSGKRYPLAALREI